MYTLWLPFGETRTDIINNIQRLRTKYPEFIMNTEKQLKRNEKGTGEGLKLLRWTVLRGQYYRWIIKECQNSLVVLEAPTVKQ